MNKTDEILSLVEFILWWLQANNKHNKYANHVVLEGDMCYRKKEKSEQSKCYWVCGAGVQF